MNTIPRRTLLTVPLLGAGAALGAAAPAVAAPLPTLSTAGSSALAAPARAGGSGRRGADRLLRRWAQDTWRSLDAMTVRSTGLISDAIGADLEGHSGNTSPTNIGGGLWSTLIARELRLITPGEARHRISRTLGSLETMEHHEPSGMFYNWYDETDGSVLRSWPGTGEPVVPFVSSVDMGWLGAALHVVAEADPTHRRRAKRLFDAMRWDVFFDRDVDASPGLTVGGFWSEDPEREGTELRPLMGDIPGADVWYHSEHHYDTAVSEARMVTYLGIMTEQIPAGAYYSTFRTFPPGGFSAEMPPVGEWTEHEGVPVFEGAHTYRGMEIVPGWGGSMFEELMPDLFVPEASWGPGSWGRNHPLHVRAQREHGLDEAGYGYWGFSPCSDPHAGYREYGVDALGLNPAGYFSDAEETDWHHDQPTPAFGDGVVTPHAAALALQYEREEATENLTRIEEELGAYGPGGFYDAVAVRSGVIATRHLSLDQSMVLGALGNVLLDEQIHEWFGTDEVAASLRPLIAQETFRAHG